MSDSTRCTFGEFCRTHSKVVLWWCPVVGRARWAYRSLPEGGYGPFNHLMGAVIDGVWYSDGDLEGVGYLENLTVRDIELTSNPKNWHKYDVLELEPIGF